MTRALIGCGGRLAHRAGGTTILTTTTSGRLAVVRA